MCGRKDRQSKFHVLGLYWYTVVRYMRTCGHPRGGWCCFDCCRFDVAAAGADGAAPEAERRCRDRRAPRVQAGTACPTRRSWARAARRTLTLRNTVPQMALSGVAPTAAEAEMLRALAAHPELALPNTTTQRGEHQPLEQCEQALRAALSADVCGFLRRHGRLLRYEDLALFERRIDALDTRDSMLADVLEDLRLRLSPAPQRRSATVRNRRFNYLARRLVATDYFTVEAMAARRPELYAQYIQDKTVGNESDMDPAEAAVEHAEIEAAQIKKFRNEVGASGRSPEPVVHSRPAPVAHWGALPPAGKSENGAGGKSCTARATSGSIGNQGGMWGEFETSSAAEDAAQSKKLRDELADTFVERSRQEQLQQGKQPNGGSSCGQIVADIQRMSASASGHASTETHDTGLGVGSLNGGAGVGVSSWQAGAEDGPDEESSAYQLAEFTEAMKRLWLNGEDQLFDYDEVDLNAANDDWQQQQQDQEDDYFNGDDEDDDCTTGGDGGWDDDGDGDRMERARGQRPSEASRKREREALRARALAALSS
eukprot:COSAG02_NODE_1879_length_10557_cov_2.360976_4_plen_541_part_00